MYLWQGDRIDEESGMMLVTPGVGALVRRHLYGLQTMPDLHWNI